MTGSSTHKRTILTSRLLCSLDEIAMKYESRRASRLNATDRGTSKFGGLYLNVSHSRLIQPLRTSSRQTGNTVIRTKGELNFTLFPFLQATNDNVTVGQRKTFILTNGKETSFKKAVAMGTPYCCTEIVKG